MTQIKILITPDGKFKHIYNDNLLRLDRALGEVNISRASHVEYDNETQAWRIRVEGCLLPERFAERAAALQFEVDWLEENCLRE